MPLTWTVQFSTVHDNILLILSYASLAPLFVLEYGKPRRVMVFIDSLEIFSLATTPLALPAPFLAVFPSQEGHGDACHSSFGSR